MALRRKVVDLIGLHLLDDADQVGGVGQVTVMRLSLTPFSVRVLVEMIPRAVLNDEDRRLTP